MKASADVADSPASFQPLKAQTSAGARRPSGRRSQRSGCIESTVPRPLGAPVLDAPSSHGRRAARRGRRRRRLRLLAQGPADGALRHAVPGARAARPHAARSQAARSATRTCWPAASSAAISCAWRAASSASATSCRSRCGRSRGPRAPIRRRSCPSPTATSTSSTASSSTSRARSTTRRTAGCSSGCSATTRCAPSGGARRARAAATTPTSAGCSSTPSRSARWRSNAPSCIPRLNPDLLLTAALVHDLGKTREFTYGAEIGLTDEGRLLGHVVLGQQILDALRAARRPPARARALRAHPPRAGGARRAGGSARAEALALYRLNALDASVKGALGARAAIAQLLGCASCAS